MSHFLLPLLLLAPFARAGSLGTAERPRGLDSVYAPRRVAVVVGIDRYRDPDLPPLRFSAKDARDLGAVLEDPRHGGFDRVVVLDHPEAATAAGIRRAIDFATADLQRDDTFLLYLSGHGTLTVDAGAGTRLWFLPSDGRVSDPQGTGLDVAWLEGRVGSVAARRRVLVLDTCHDGRDKSALSPDTRRLLGAMRGDPPAPRLLRDVSESEARLFAAQVYQPAMEDPELQNGVYTHFLVQALTGEADRADLDGDGLVDVVEAHDWARDHTISYTGGIQVPRAEYRIVGREEIYLSGDPRERTRAERALVTTTDGLLASARILVDGTPRGVGPGVVPVEPGSHSIELRDQDDRRLLRRRVRLRAGDTLPLEDLLRPREPAIELAGGALWRSGPGASYLSPGAALAELAWVDPVQRPWLSTDAHLRASGWRGTTGDQGPLVEVRSGELAAGVAAALRLPPAAFSLGPTLDLGLPWRTFDDVEGHHRQAALALVPGGRATLRLPLWRSTEAVLRYDLRWLPFSYEGRWTSATEQGLTVGVALRRGG